MFRSSFTRLGVIGGAAVLILGLGGCSNSVDNNSGSGQDGDGLTKVTIGHLPIASAAPVLYGVENGFFEEEGLDVELAVAQGGAALVPAVLNNQYQFGYSNNLSLIAAYGKKLPVKIIHVANGSGSEPEPAEDGVLVTNDSGIETFADLAGKTVASNGLNNLPHLGLLLALENAGVDPSSVTVVEVGYPDMQLALTEDRVDAAIVGEPFVARAMATNEFSDLGSAYRAISEDLPLSSWFTTTTYLESSPEVVSSFYKAVERSNEFAVNNPERLAEFVPSYLKVSEEEASNIDFADFPLGVPSVSMLELISSEAAGFGVIPEEITGLDGLVWDPQA